MKKLGFGCMRLPMNGEEVDLVEFSVEFVLGFELSNLSNDLTAKAILSGSQTSS